MRRSTCEAGHKPVEGRPLGQIKCEGGTSMESSEFQQQMTATKLKRIAWLSSQSSGRVFNNLMHLINPESLKDCFRELDGKKAVGADGISKDMYGENLEGNLQDLIARMKRMAYRPGPVREVLIPKPDKPDARRPLGISNLEDKLVQKMTQKILESIYEPLFLECSYGFRAGRGCHDAIRALHNYLYKNNVEIVIDLDISNFFGTVSHSALDSILRGKITDKTFMRYIHRMFKAGVLKDNELTVSDEGVMQGSICSPVLSNIYAHYVLDNWFEKVVKKHCKGKVELFRYCDDGVICCQFKTDAERIRRALSKRLAKFNLRLNEDKTHCVSFAKQKQCQGNKQGTFDFLGFTFYLSKSRQGVVIPKVKTSRKRLRSKLKAITVWIKANRNKMRLMQIWKPVQAKLRGHIQYYGVSFNLAGISQFLYECKRILFKWLNRRSQRKSFDWQKFQLFMDRHPLPPLKVCHKFF
jgi:RNA-directed DNA polymerase